MKLMRQGMAGYNPGDIPRGYSHFLFIHRLVYITIVRDPPCELNIFVPVKCI